MSIPKLEFPPFHLPPEAEQLRGEVRAFLKETLPKIKSEDRFASWNTFSPEFSKALGAKGWLGITWPKQYGGHERTFLERFVVTEELLGNSAPAGAHWVADRQSGPVLLRFGSEEQRQAILPRIARGECYFSIGMSEPDSGSDLASVRTRAEPVPGGFRVNGTKVWTSGAHRNHYCITLVRTSGQHNIALFGEFPAGFPGGWKATDNTVIPLADVDAFRAMYASMTAQGTENFNHSQDLKAQLAFAKTPEEIAEREAARKS